MRLLMLLYHAPPRTTVAALRAERFLAHLGAEGVEPLVVTPGPSGETGERFETMGGATFSVTRFSGVDPLAGWHRAKAGAAARGEPGSRGRSTVEGRSPSPAIDWKRALRSLAVPDERAGLILPWARTALSAAREGVDAVYSSSSPYSAHLAARKVARTLMVPWILEMRDLWADNSYLPQTANPLSRKLQERWERQCLAAASRVVVLTEAHREHLSRRYPEFASRLRVVPNGFSPGEEREPALRPGPRRLLYAGNFYGGRTLASVGRAVDQLHQERGSDPGFRLEVAGRSFDRPMSEVLGGEGPERVLHGVLPPGEVQSLLREVHMGVLHNPARDRIHIPAKLYDYLGAGLPILDLTTQPDIPGLAEGVAPCWKVGEGDVEGLKTALGELAAWWEAHPRGAGVPDSAHPLAAGAITRRLAEVIWDALPSGGRS